MLLSVFLDYLNSEFHIQRLLSAYSDAATHELLNISNQMLVTVMILVKQHNLKRELQRDYAWVILFYGVSSAGVLAAELNRSARTGHALPPTVSRSEVIRSLSVMISYLEWVTRPGEGNHAACSEASKMLARILDEALDPSPIPTNDRIAQPELESAGRNALLAPVEGQTILESNGNDSLSEPLPMDSGAFLDWFDSVDWNNPMVF